MILRHWIRKIFLHTFSKTQKDPRKTNKHKLHLLSLEDRIVPAVPFSPAFPYTVSINAAGSSPITSSGSFTVTFSKAVVGVDAADFQIVNTGTVAAGTISSVTGSGASYTVNVTGITGNGTVGLKLVDTPSITALASFASQATFGTGNNPFSVTLGDVNGDGKLDIVATNSDPTNSISVLLGNGNGTFAAQTTFATETNPLSVTLGDVNGDGKLDIVTANYGGNNTSVLLGNGNGTFAAQTTFATGFSPYFVTLGDVNADGRLDILTANNSADNVSVLINSLAFTGQTYTVQNQTLTSTNLVSSANPSVFGQSVVFTATVTGSSPTGTVTFKNGSTTLGTGTLNGSGIATFSTSSLAVGSGHSITAEYAGDSNNQASTSSPVAQTVNQAGSTTVLTAAPNPSVFGQSVTFTATVTAVAPGAGIPTGTVTFFDGASQIGTGTLSSGVATLSTSSLAVGSGHSITAVFAGDTNFTASTSSATSFTVNLPPTITSASSTSFIQGLSTNSFQVTATGFPATFTYGVTAGTLPNGVTLNSSTGLLSGAPVGGTVGVHEFTISVSNGVDPVASQPFTLTVNPAPAPLITGSAPPNGNDPANPGSSVNLYDAQTGQPNGVAVPFPNFMGQVRVASGDFNVDGRSEIVAAAGPGGGPAVTILDSSTGEPLFSFFAYDSSFTGGVYVAVKDVNNDGVADIITGAGAGGGPHVKIFNGATRQEMASFFAYAENFSGGVSVASADINRDNVLDIVTGAGPGGGPHVKVFDGASQALISQWFAYPADFTGGVFVAMGDISNDGNFEVVTGAGQGGAPVVAVWNPFTGALQSQFMAYAQVFSGGVRVGVSDATGDGINDLITGAGPGGTPHVKAFNYPNLDLLFEFFSGPETDPTGVFVS